MVLGEMQTVEARSVGRLDELQPLIEKLRQRALKQSQELEEIFAQDVVEGGTVGGTVAGTTEPAKPAPLPAPQPARQASG